MNINQPSSDAMFAESQPEEREQKGDPIQSVNPISLLKKPDEFKQAFFSMVCLSTEAFKAKNYERAALALLKCTDMLDLGRNILKDINRYWKLVVFANLACCYHYTRKLSKCNKFCQKVKEQIQRILADGPEKQIFLKLTRILIKLKFQHCAILSQLEQHNRAFQLCKSTIPMLKQYIQVLLNYVEANSSLDPIERRSSETVHFSRQVHRFAQTLLSDLLRCINEPLKKQERTTFYYWQKNPEQNEQQVKKKFIPHSENSNCKRSILGVSKSTHWIDEFNIGTIMHFSEMSINDFDISVPIEEYLFKDRLYEMVIYCSMANFTMATELRLIQSTQQEKEEPEHNQYNSLLKKYGYEEKSELFKLSEIYHLRSIEIMARNIKTTVPYITHIIRSYEKHYIKHKKILEPIAAIVEESALSLNQSLAADRNGGNIQKQESYYETTYNNYVRKQEMKNQYQECQPVADLLLESQRNPQDNVRREGCQKEVQVIKEEEEEKKQFKDQPELNSWVEPKKQEQSNKHLLTVRSEGVLPKMQLESPRDEHNSSGQYLKSQRKEVSRVKKSQLNRQKSSSKAGQLRNSNPTGKHPSNKNDYHHKDTLKQHKKHHKTHHKDDAPNDYKLKGDTKAANKDKDRKTIKGEIDHDKYREKEIKIKTESCTHIKVLYKKKK